MGETAPPCGARKRDAAIDARKPATDDVAHISRLAIVGELTASIAHEIHQPLGAILANAEAGALLVDRVHAGDRVALDALREVLSDVRRDARRASVVIRQVREMAGRREPESERIDANALAFHAVRLLDAERRRRGMRIDVAPLPGDAVLHGDRGQLERVLVNLLLNAMDAMEDAPAEAIVLGVARTQQGAIELCVRDAGQGIPEAHLPRLFHSFHTTKAHGLGLGLSIARSIVEAHGGWIRAENNDGRGATFRVAFPACAGRAT